MLSENVTVCIFAWNEQARLARCFENFRGLFHLLVVDNHSTDATVEVAESHGVRAIRVKNPGFVETPEVMGPVLATCQTDYVIIASVSEFVPLALLKVYADVANSRSHDIVRAFRVSITAGLAIPISGRPSRRFKGDLRFFKKGSVSHAGNKVHQLGNIVVAPGRVLSVVTTPRLWFYQFREYDCSHTEHKHRQYNDVLARQYYDDGLRFGWGRMLYRSSKQFLNSYLRFGSYRYGMLGFIHSVYRFYMELGIWFRVWEWERQFDIAHVVFRNDEVRRSLEDALRNERSALPEAISR